MNFRDNYLSAHATEDHARVTELEQIAWDTAWNRALETCSVDSPQFDALQESIYNEMVPQ